MHSTYQKSNSYLTNSNIYKLRGFLDGNGSEEDAWRSAASTESRIVILKLECFLQLDIAVADLKRSSFITSLPSTFS